MNNLLDTTMDNMHHPKTSFKNRFPRRLLAVGLGLAGLFLAQPRHAAAQG